MLHAKQFPFIVKWHKRSGSFQYYIQQMLNLAHESKAPSNAIYERHGKWITTEDIRNDQIISEWNLPNKPDKEELKLHLNETCLRGLAYIVIETLIEKCETFMEASRIMEIIKVFK